MEATELREETARISEMQQRNAKLAEENTQLKNNQAKWEERLASLMRHFKAEEQASR
jgi:FtsZ-binding cell division protein ZapB